MFLLSAGADRRYFMDLFATLGPACARKDILCAMFRAGMTGIRYNLAHGSLADAEPWIRLYRDAAKECGVESPRLLLDLQGPGLRIHKGGAAIQLRQGSILHLEHDLQAPQVLIDNAEPGDVISIADGAFELEVQSYAQAKVIRGGRLLPGKNVCIVGKELESPALTSGDLDALSAAKRLGVTDIMLSFVRSADDLRNLHKVLEEYGLSDLRVYAKIETLEGLSAIASMYELADVFLLARGDLGNRLPLWHLPRVQKRMAAKLQSAGKPFAISTQLLSTMETNRIPTRAEVNDVFNAVLDGAQCLFLTGETAIGAYPAEAMDTLARTAHDAQDFLTYQNWLAKRNAQAK